MTIEQRNVIASKLSRAQTTHEKLLSYLHAALATSTLRAYRADLKHFREWGGSVPATPEMVASYLAAHAGFLAIATLTRRLVAIRCAHDWKGFETPTTAPLVKATLKGIRREHGSRQRQVAAVLKDEMLSMVTPLTGLQGSRDKALLLIGFAGAFRRSELVGLQLKDLEFVEEGLLIHLLRSKTDQYGIGRKVAIPYAHGNMCPVKSLKQWIKDSKVKSGPIFRRVDKSGHLLEQGLTAQSVALIVKRCAEQAGLDPSRYSGHSLRAGLITSAAKAGVSSSKIRQQSGHRSDAMLNRYIREGQAFADNAAGAVL